MEFKKTLQVEKFNAAGWVQLGGVGVGGLLVRFVKTCLAEVAMGGSALASQTRNKRRALDTYFGKSDLHFLDYNDLRAR